MNKPDPSRLKAGVDSAALAASHSTARWLKGLTLLTIGGWVLLGLLMWSRKSDVTGGPGAGPMPTADTRPARPAYTSTGKGPWGRLMYLPITISPPLELIPHSSPSTWKGEWHFPNTISARLPALLSEIGLSEPLREKLVSLAEVNPETEGLVIRPTRELVLGLDAEERLALYALLAGFGPNFEQRSFRFCGSSLDEWIGESPLSPETRRLIEPLVYRHGSFLFFSDLSAIEDLLTSPEQISLLIKALSHQSTFLVELELTDETDLEELVDYWGRGGRAGEVRPILESLLHEADGERSIDITYLLPPFARSRLYTYHVMWEDVLRYRQDCHWSALNFFSEVPDDRYGDVNEVHRALEQDYVRIYGNLRLGDVVAFIDQTTTIHTAVFVADDFLFTKNGRGSASPWMLMKLEDMKYYYLSRKALTVYYYRRKDL